MKFLFWQSKIILLEAAKSVFVLPADIGACESIMKKKTKQDFQELIKTEHGNCRSLTRFFSCSYPSDSQPPKKMLSSSLQLPVLAV